MSGPADGAANDGVHDAGDELADDLPPATLAWPEGLDHERFLAEVWQRRPLLMRGALPGFRTPIDPDELAGLALEPDTTPRLLLEGAAGDFRVEHGPFEESRFASLDGRFSLLVTDVEKHLPELGRWIRAFRLLPAWRFDDLMISYAPDGGSVGAHVDAYDVFLLQASGRRRWSIDASTAGAGAAPRTVRRGDLELVEPFEPTDTWELEPGDALYLPPGVAHHGVAVGEGCTTWSIGFRAPSAAEVVAGVAALLVEELDEAPLADPPLAPGSAGEIGRASLDALRRVWDEATRLDDAAFAALVGRVLTTRIGEGGTDRADGPDDAKAPDRCGDDAGLERDPFARLAWADDRAAAAGDDRHVTLFADGRSLECSAGLATRLCDPDAAVPSRSRLSAADAAVVDALVGVGVLRDRDERDRG